MIARINTGGNVGGAVRYNETKLKNGEARIISVSEFASRRPEELSSGAKINMMEALCELNPRVKEPVKHIVLAFHPSEKLSDEKLREIANEYMDRMGFGEQPKIVYRHEDTGSPHIHIVTVAIDADGKRITDSNERRRSNFIREALEIKHGLVKANEQTAIIDLNSTLPGQAIQYGQAQSKQAIGTVVQTAMKDYTFARLEDFNRFINHYGVTMTIRQGKGEANWKGLTFQIVEGDKPLSPAIKASSYHFKPTLEKLGARFKNGEKKIDLQRAGFNDLLGNTVNNYEKLSESDYKGALRNLNIQVIDDGKSYVYIDHKRRSVFSEGDVDGRFSRQRLTKSFTAESVIRQLPIAGEIGPSPATGLPPAVVPPPLPRSVRKGLPVDEGQPDRGLTEKERHVLGRLVSARYQAYKAQQGIYFESQLIRNFPHQVLVEALVNGGKSSLQAQQAVTEFERYKTGNLTEIRSREVAGAGQQATSLVALVGQMPIRAQDRIQFLEQMNFTVSQDRQGQYQLVHKQDAGLMFPLTGDAYQKLLRGTQTGESFERVLRPVEKAVYLAAASGGSEVKASFYEVHGEQLKRVLPPVVYSQLSGSLNRNYLSTIESHLIRQGTPPDAQPAAYLHRGVLIEQRNGQYVAGHYQTDPATYQPVPKSLALFLNKQGLPADYAQQRAALQTPSGLTRLLYLQGLDTNSPNRTQYIEQRTAARNPALAGKTGQDLLNAFGVAAQQETGSKPGIDGSGQQRSIRIKADALPPLVSEKERISKLVWKDYFVFRAQDRYYFESTLLAQPLKFPVSRLVTTLTSEPHRIAGPVAQHVVEQFKADRLGRLGAVRKKDEAKYEKISGGYLSMVSQAPVSGKDRQTVLNALGLGVEKSDNGYVLFHRTDKSFRRILTALEAQNLLAVVPKPERLVLPNQEFPRLERQLYERIALGEKLGHFPGEKNPLTLLSVDANRVKKLVGEQTWQANSGWLNENTVLTATQQSPISGQAKADWLYQRGLVVTITGTKTTIGHYLTDPATHTAIGLNVANVLAAVKPPISPAADQISRLNSERGQIMLSLSAAIDSGNPKNVAFVMNRITDKMPEFMGIAVNPQRVLDQLSLTTGPYRAEIKRDEQAAEPSPEVQAYEPTDEPAADNMGELIRSIGKQDPKQKRKTNQTHRPKKLK